MKKCIRRFRPDSSGQILILAALAIAILVSSTTIYVYELSNETSSADTSPISTFVFALRQGTRNAMMGSLANVSNGGDEAVLTANLKELSEVFRSLHHYGICQLAFTLRNDSQYDSGAWLSWNTSNMGVSSAYANFTLGIYSITSSVIVDYTVNITTAVSVTGSYTSLEGVEKLVNLTCSLYNEDEPALARNVALYYENLGSWTMVDASNSLSVEDYGNGTYSVSFVAQIASEAVQVSAHVYDSHDVFVRANATCYET